jgi:tetratricopeptide (TPR) repeat protein
VAVVVFAVAAGVLVARAAGTGTAGQSARGDIRAQVRQQLDQSLQLSAQGQLLESIKCYDGVLTEQPSSAEANAYRGWTLTRVQDQRLWSAAQQNLDQAVLLDPSYADARVFRAVLERDQGRLDAARADLAAFDALDPPQMMRDLVDQLGLRASLQPGAGGSTPASGAPGGAAEPSAGSGSGAPATTATPPPATGG